MASSITCVPLLFRYFYVSRIAPGVPRSAVADILRVSRAFNRQHEVSGVLLFDGEHFAQLLEGGPEHVEPLAARIESDARHTDVDVRLRVQGRLERRFRDWRCGWVDQEGLIEPLADAAVPMDAQLARFAELAAGSDIS